MDEVYKRFFFCRNPHNNLLQKKTYTGEKNIQKNNNYKIVFGRKRNSKTLQLLNFFSTKRFFFRFRPQKFAETNATAPKLNKNSLEN